MFKTSLVILALLASVTAMAVVNGGTIARTGEYPASRSVMLVLNQRDGRPSGFCTAVLIGKNIGLTAAHCFEHSSPTDTFKVVFGLSQWAPANRMRAGGKFKIHPLFRSNPGMIAFDFGSGVATSVADEKTFVPNATTKLVTQEKHYDIAIFSFIGDYPEDMKPALVLDREMDLSNADLYIYGAGHSMYINQKDTAAYYKTGEFGFLRRGKAKVNSNYSQFADFYFTSPASQAKTCMGDSGGPQFLASAKYPTVMGINSAMIVNDLDGNNVDSVCGNTALVTKTSTSSTWINQEKAELLLDLQK